MTSVDIVLSSDIRSRTFPAVERAPSCVCRNDWAFAKFVLTASVRLIAADNFIDTASPPASSDGFTIFIPLDRRLRLFCSIALLLLRLFLATVAAEFVFIVTGILLSSLILLRQSWRGMPVSLRQATLTSVLGRCSNNPVYLFGLFEIVVSIKSLLFLSLSLLLGKRCS